MRYFTFFIVFCYALLIQLKIVFARLSDPPAHGTPVGPVRFIAQIFFYKPLQK